MLTKRFLVTVLLLAATAMSAMAGDLMQLVPENTAFLLNVNLGKMFATEAIKKQIDEGMAKQPADQKKAFDEFVAKTGIDPFKHLKSIVVFAAAKVDPKADKQDAGVLIDGTFEIAKILESIKSDKKASEDVSIEKFEGFDAVKGKKEADGMGVFLDNTTAVVGTNPAIKTVVDVKSGKAKSVANNAALGSLLKKVDTGATLWGVGLIPQTLKDQAKANPQAAPLAAVNSLFFSFNYDANLTFNFTGEVDKKENMDAVMTSLNGFLAMVKMLAGQTPEAAEILNMIKVEAVETAAKITLNVPKAKLDEVRKKIEERMKAAPAPAAEPSKDQPAPAADQKPTEEKAPEAPAAPAAPAPAGN